MSHKNTAQDNSSDTPPLALVEPDANLVAHAPAGTAPPANPQTWADRIAATYASVLMPFPPDNPTRRAGLVADAHALLAKLAPRDAIEQMLAAQLLLLQARIQFLSGMSVYQPKLSWSHVFSTQLERAVTAYQKVLASLQDHQRPRSRRRTSITTIRTAHITARQLINTPATASIHPKESHALTSQPQVEKTQPKAAQGPPTGEEPQT